MTAATDDAELMRQIANGDAGVYRTMMNAHLDPIYRFSWRLLQNSGDAEEVVQETFLRAWSRAADYQPRARLTTWLHRIAHNLCIDRLRARRPVGESSSEEAPASGEPGVLLERKQTAERVRLAIDALPERQRAALILVHYQGLSGTEAAEVLQCKIEALESLLARARRNLRERLGEVFR